MAQVYDETFTGSIAENYERYFVPVIPAPLAADLVETAALARGEYVLDVACGTGVVTRLAAARVGREGRVVGVDVNPGMLDVARSLPAPDGAEVEWREASAEALPFPDESFDVVCCQLGLMFVPDRAAATREMRRVLSPGGRLALNTPGRIPPVFEAMGEALARHVDPALAGFVGAVFSLHDPAALGELLQDAGFADVRAEVTTRTLRLPPPADFLWQYVHATPMAAVVAQAGADAWEAAERDIVNRWEDFVDGGALILDQPVVVATARA
jgi:ubiquinone/menaquinone biosynthesis C-methylase UbiE